MATATRPAVLNLDELRNDLDAGYRYIGVYYTSATDAPTVSRLRLLYDRIGSGDEVRAGAWSDHPGAFAARINQWSDVGPYCILAFTSVADVRETLDATELHTIPMESEQ